jgi:hypothetical protein
MFSLLKISYNGSFARNHRLFGLTGCFINRLVLTSTAICSFGFSLIETEGKKSIKRAKAIIDID